jgi:hypothetical protein
MERTNVFLGAEDRARIEVLRARYGLASAGAAIRLAIKLAVPEDQRSDNQPGRRRAGSGRGTPAAEETG